MTPQMDVPVPLPGETPAAPPDSAGGSEGSDDDQQSIEEPIGISHRRRLMSMVNHKEPPKRHRKGLKTSGNTSNNNLNKMFTKCCTIANLQIPRRQLSRSSDDQPRGMAGQPTSNSWDTQTGIHIW